MARTCGVHTTIITCKYTNSVHDVSRGCCQSSQFPSILSLLQIDNPNVTNCLIDQKKIEKIVLMPKDHDAQELLKSEHSVPRNLLYSLTGDFNQFYPAPSYRSYAINRRNSAVLQTSVSEHLERLEQELDSYKTQLEVAHDELRRMQQQYKAEEDEYKQVIFGKFKDFAKSFFNCC